MAVCNKKLTQIFLVSLPFLPFAFPSSTYNCFEIQHWAMWIFAIFLTGLKILIRRVQVCLALYNCINIVCTYHSGILLSHQDSQTRIHRASVWGPMRQIKAINLMFLSTQTTRYCFTTFHCISSFKIVLSAIPTKPDSQIWQQQKCRPAYQAAVSALSICLG